MIAEFPARQWKQRTFLRKKEHMNNSFLVSPCQHQQINTDIKINY